MMRFAMLGFATLLLFCPSMSRGDDPDALARDVMSSFEAVSPSQVVEASLKECALSLKIFYPNACNRNTPFGSNEYEIDLRTVSRVEFNHVEGGTSVIFLPARKRGIFGSERGAVKHTFIGVRCDMVRASMRTWPALAIIVPKMVGSDQIEATNNYISGECTNE